jgi:16S rRNA (guanine527-N7)-methyltransferase
VLLEHWKCRTVLIDSMVKRSTFLREVLGWSDAPEGGEVIMARVEEAARWPELEDQFDLVTARSFGPPAVTAECAARFLKTGGVLIVSEPPTAGDEERWSAQGLARLGFLDRGRTRFGAAFEVLVKTEPTPAEFPRASGTPKKHPLF